MAGSGEHIQTPHFYERQGDEVLIRNMVELSSDYYWEQDEKFRFTLIRHRDPDKEKILADHFVGKTWWELGGIPETGNKSPEESASSHPQLAYKTFHDLIIHHTVPGKKEKYFSINGVPVFNREGTFLGYRGITREVTEEKVHERLQQLERQVSRILLDVEKITDGIQEAIHSICISEDWDAGQYWHPNNDKGVMRYFAGWYVDPESVHEVVDNIQHIEFSKGSGLVGAVWESGKTLWVSDLTKEGKLQRKNLAALTGWRQGLLFPVNFGNEVIGVLAFYAVHIQEPDERLLSMFQILGTLIGNYLHRLDALEQLRESEDRYHSTVELAAIGITHVSTNGRFIHVNPRFCSMLGYTPDELTGTSVKAISHPDDIDATDQERDKLRKGEIEFFKIEKRYLHKKGTTVWVSLTITTKRDKHGRSLYDISIVEDITTRVEAEQKVQYLATHDEMTNLPNRALFLQLLSQALASGKRYHRKFAVIFIDLDRFKHINDSLGHEAGDKLLINMASRFRDCLRNSDIVARLGGDEFVVLVQEISLESQVALVARNILSAAIKPMEIMGQDCRVTASLGICMYPDGAQDEQTLMKHADMAMYQAKAEGKNNYQFYSEAIVSHTIEKMALESHLRRAMENREFQLHYQAKVNIGSGSISGVEALLRWNNPELGSISPSRFIPVAEEMGLIIPLGKWVLRTACEHCIAWQKQGLAPICVSVNISPRQFSDPDLTDYIKEVLNDTGMEPALLELEVTESMIMHNMDEAITKLNEFKALGVQISIDDFGTGYSSLSQLKQFPIDTLKVDRSFIRDLPYDQEDMAITQAIITMGKTLGLTVIAEGVETEAQQAFLKSHACDQMQGFYFSKAIPPDQIPQLFENAKKK